MADIRPFSAIRPRADLAEQIAALPYDVFDEKEARRFVNERPGSFLTIDRAETQFPEGQDPYAREVYEKARELLWGRVEAGDFIKDEKPCYYIYEQEWRGRTQTGIVACASIDDYTDGVIKKHENTRRDKEEDRVRHIDVCGAHTGPIFLCYRRSDELSRILSGVKTSDPIYDFTSHDGTKNRIWAIAEDEEISAVSRVFEGMESVYIADGHHRCASAVRVGLERREKGIKDDSGHFLSVLFPDNELEIMDYNRVVRDLNGLSKEAFMNRVKDIFDVSEAADPVSPSKKGEFGMLLEDRWYRLEVKPEYTSDDAVKGLDVSVLQDNLLGPVLGIEDPRTDTRIDFVGGVRGLEELERRVADDMTVAFSMHPTTLAELFRVADEGRLMPPKSTWFEPKLLSGLFIHAL